VLLVDDHALVCEGVRAILERQDDLHVVGQAGDSARTIELTADKRPDVVLLDIEIPGGDAATTVRKILDCSPRSRVIILSMYEGPELVDALLTAGVRGYLLKNVRWQELVTAIRTVVADNDRVVLGVSRESLRPLQRPSAPEEMLSAREREVLALVGEALSNRQIANRLSLTEATVKRHLRKIFAKLGAVSRMDAVKKASMVPPATLRGAHRAAAPDRPLENSHGEQGHVNDMIGARRAAIRPRPPACF
jgi:DNA-binding NarL/FixJ family response regulator